MNIKLSISLSDLSEYLISQIKCFFPDKHPFSMNKYNSALKIAIDRTYNCFKYIRIPGYNIDGQTVFNHLHSDQYATFLWFLSNTLWREFDDKDLATKMFYLNKALHGLNCMYDTILPDIFLLFHVTGTVLGKAEYSDFLCVAHNCTVGAQQGKYPKLGRGVGLLTGSKVIGECIIENGVSIGVGTVIYNKNVKKNTVAFTNELGQLCFKSREKPWTENMFYMD